METTDATPSAPGDYLGSYMSQNNFPEASPGDLPVPQIEDTPAPVAPDAPAAAAEKPKNDPIETPQTPSPNQAAGAQRIAAKRKYEEELTALKSQLSEWEQKYNNRSTELETQLTEHRKLAEERAARIEEIEKSYRNSAEQEWHHAVDELPQVRKTAQEAEKAFIDFFPKRLSNPSEDEVDVRFNLRDLPQDRIRQVEGQITQWANAEYNQNASPGSRAAAQQVAISNIARVIGVRPEALEEKIIGNETFQVLRPSHPVYRHLSDQLPNLVDARINHHQTRQEATGNVRESFLSATRQRQETSKNILREAGLTLSGDELENRLKQAPDNTLLRTVKLLQSDPDLHKELQDSIEHEALLNGHFSPQLALVETDPGERTKVAQAHLQRIGARFIHAPLAGPLQKLVLKQDAELQQMRAKLKYYMDEESAAASQNEPGLAGGAPPSGNEKPMFDGPGAKYYDKAAKTLGLHLTS